MEAAEEGQVVAEFARRADIMGHGQLVLDPDHVVVRAVAGRGVDEAGARLVGDVIAGEEGDIVVPFAVRVGCAVEGVARDHSG